MDKIWVNSGDSHVLEPEDLWTSVLPPHLAERAPRTERAERYETIYVDGRVQRRALNVFMDSFRPPGARDLSLRLADMDSEGIWAQMVFPSMGLWTVMIDDPELAAACVRAYNDWLYADYMSRSDRMVGCAVVSMASLDDAVDELERVAEMGYRCVFLPTSVPDDRQYGFERWEPFWTVAERAGLVVGFHIGTGSDAKPYKGPGGAVVNYVETTYPGMRVVTQMVASGALDRHPDLRIMIAEGGASWVPAIADRMDEGYRQHGAFVQPKLSMLPSEIIYRQVFTSFQHDSSAVAAMTAMGYRNIMWGDDYPHLEGTYGHTQKTLHELFDDVDPAVTRHITADLFQEIFDTPPIPA